MTPVQLISRNPIVRKIADGDAKDDILQMVVGRQLPLTEEEYLESLVFVMKHEMFKLQALECLKELTDSTKLSYVERRDGNPRVSYYILLESLNAHQTAIIGKIIQNQTIPPEFLIKIAEKADTAILEMLLENQIKLIAYPEIMEAMEKNPTITNFILGRIHEIRTFYLSKENAAEIPLEAVIDDLKETMLLDGEKKNGEEGEENDSESESDEEEDMDIALVIEKKAKSLIQEINNMSISERIKLALGGTKTQRMVLIKDSNKMVSLAVIESPKISIDEISILSKNKSLPSEIIAKISINREWTKNYPIMLELVQNPKTPIKSALSFIKQLHIQDLRQVTVNRNINPVIRSLAINFYSQKTGTKK